MRMRIYSITIVLFLAVASSTLDAQEPRAAATTRIAGDLPSPSFGMASTQVATATKPAFVFRDVSYFHRWSKDNQHEFTPEKQENLDKWSDMMTVNAYPDVHDGERLAQTANAVLDNYKRHQARVLKTNSVPRTPDRPAEHLIAVVFGRPNFIEVAFARLKLVDGTGYSFVYSHRIYGEKIGDEMSAWLRSNGATVEKTLMEWNSMPSLSKIDNGKSEARRQKSEDSAPENLFSLVPVRGGDEHQRYTVWVPFVSKYRAVP